MTYIVNKTNERGNNTMKKLVSILTLIAVTSLSISVVFANERQFVNSEKVSASLKEELQTNLNNNDVNGLNSKMVVPSKEEVKGSLLEEFNKNPELHKDNILAVDELAEQYVNWAEANKNNDLASQDWRWYPHFHVWVEEPYIYASYEDKQYDYSNSYEVDNRNSSIPYNLKRGREIEFYAKLGFEGSAEVKTAFKGGVKLEGSVKQKATIESDVTVPPGTFWKATPYAITQYELAMGVQSTFKITPDPVITIPRLEHMGIDTYYGKNKTAHGNGVKPSTIP